MNGNVGYVGSAVNTGAPSHAGGRYTVMQGGYAIGTTVNVKVMHWRDTGDVFIRSRTLLAVPVPRNGDLSLVAATVGNDRARWVPDE